MVARGSPSSSEIAVLEGSPREAFAPPAVDRLRRSSEISATLRKGKRARQRLVHVAALPNGLPRSRFALSVSKRVGSAVVRNRVKRRLRVLLRSRPPRGGYDIVVTAHVGADSVPIDDLMRDIERCLRHVGVLSAEGA
ncbi:MAG: ribonuclease P protein component [Chloroflexi bacterium]|nr:ribonuclease P protein component [Chloroflexota bacterium]